MAMNSIDATTMLSTSPDRSSWLTTSQIIGYLELLTRNNPLWTFLEEPLVQVEKVMDRIMDRIMDHQKILYPICFNSHWTLLIIRDGYVRHYDPYHREEIPEKVVELATVLEWPLTRLRDGMPRQEPTDTVNCGIFVMKAARIQIDNVNWTPTNCWQFWVNTRRELVKELMTIHVCRVGNQVLRPEDLEVEEQVQLDDDDEEIDVVGVNEPEAEAREQEEILEEARQKIEELLKILEKSKKPLLAPEIVMALRNLMELQAEEPIDEVPASEAGDELQNPQIQAENLEESVEPVAPEVVQEPVAPEVVQEPVAPEVVQPLEHQETNRPKEKLDVKNLLCSDRTQGSWVNSDELNKFLSVLIQKNPEFDYIDSGVVEFLSGAIEADQSEEARKEAVNVAKTIEERFKDPMIQKILLPMCLDRHWRLMIIGKDQEKLIYYDPMYSTEVPEDVDLLAAALKCEHHQPDRFPRQVDTYNCGVFCMKVAEGMVTGQPWNPEPELLKHNGFWRNTRKEVVKLLMEGYQCFLGGRLVTEQTLIMEEVPVLTPEALPDAPEALSDAPEALQDAPEEPDHDVPTEVQIQAPEEPLHRQDQIQELVPEVLKNPEEETMEQQNPEIARRAPKRRGRKPKAQNRKAKKRAAPTFIKLTPVNPNDASQQYLQQIAAKQMEDGDPLCSPFIITCGYKKRKTY